MVQQMLPPSSGVSGGALLRQDGLRSIVSRQKFVKEHCFMTRIWIVKENCFTTRIS